MSFSTIRTVRLPALHPAQQQMVREARRFNVVCAGRRTGKTVLAMDRLIHPALHGQPVAWFSPTYKMLAEVWRTVRQRLRPVTRAARTQQHTIELLTGGVVEMWSLERADAVRGRSYARVVIDEAAMVRTLSGAWQAVIRPTLTDMRGDMWMVSSPRGRNFFWECYQRGQASSAGVPPGDWMSWQFPTAANPAIDPAEIAAAQRELPERIFLQEYMAVFLDDGGGVFRRVLEAATATPQHEALPGHSYLVGCDWARSGDFTCFAVLDATTRSLAHLERFTQVEYAVQVGRLQGLCLRFRPDLVIAEQNAMGGPLVEQLQREGLPVQPFTMTAGAKMRLVDSLALAFEQGSIRILHDAVLIAEVQAYEMERLPGGTLRYGAPAGEHDDTVVALMLAWHGLERPSAAGMIGFV